MQKASGAEFTNLNWSAQASAAVLDANLRLHPFPAFHSIPFTSLPLVAPVRSTGIAAAGFCARPCLHSVSAVSGLPNYDD
ncbi:MAG: hypothetical protein Q8O52_19150 [Sulfuritalea sp.]|nr:hypothetical protein [Sulfuritalea sp.]